MIVLKNDQESSINGLLGVIREERINTIEDIQKMLDP